MQPERQKLGNGPVGVRGLPGPQMRGTRGTHLQWRDSLAWDLGHLPPWAVVVSHLSLVLIEHKGTDQTARISPQSNHAAN
jgi:hypothetical protein